MKIGISTSVVQRGKTGIAQYVFALVRAFGTHVHHHQFILFVLEEDVPLFDFAADQMEIEIVPERFRAPVKNILWHQTELPGLARRLGLDVLHVPSYRRLLWPRPCALVGTIHDLAPFHVANKYDWMRMFYGRVVARRLARRQDRIICASQNTAEDIQKCFGLPGGQITVIPNGLEHERFFPGSRQAAHAEVARKFGLKKPFFLYIARLEHPGKNHVRLVSAFNHFKTATGSDWQLVLCGSDWSGAETIHAAIKESPFAADMRALGFVADADTPGLYRAAEAFVYPSLYEGFGFPPIEAMACGCPVICSDRGSLAEVVGDAAALVDPEDVNAMAGQLMRLTADAGVREKLRAAGLARAERFDWQTTASETLRVYELAAARQQPKMARMALP